MPIKLAIIGLDPVQQEWLDAATTLRASNEIELVAVGHRSNALARDVSEYFESNPPPAYDDLRLLLKEQSPQVILIDRPSNATPDFIHTCLTNEIALLTLGPIVENLAEAQSLADILEAKTPLLYTWPRFADSYAYRHCTQADDFVRPIRFVAATWMAMNHALAKTAHVTAGGRTPVRSLSVLAWDALSTLITLVDLPATVYATIRGTTPGDDRFTDISGAAAVTLQFHDDRAASLTLCDRMPIDGGPRRDLLLMGQNGTVNLQADNYEFRDADGKLIDAGRADPILASTAPVETLREFLRHFSSPASPHRGWEHRLVDIAATLEALVVSHRTRQAESPDAFRRLRR